MSSTTDWLDNSHTAADLATASSHILITGDGGVGKRHLAWAVAAARGLTPVVVDTADATDIGTAVWVERLREAIAGMANNEVPVLVGLDRLDAAVLDDVATMIDARPAPTVATAVRPGARVAAGHPLDALSAFGLRVHIPPLRHRPGDIGPLARHFDLRHGAGELAWSPEVLQVLERYVWPGNVRELEHPVQSLLERVGPAAVVEVDHLPQDLVRRVRRRPLTRLEEAEIDVMLAALTEANGNKDLAAHLIGIHRATLYRKLQNYGLDGPPGH